MGLNSDVERLTALVEALSARVDALAGGEAKGPESARDRMDRERDERKQALRDRHETVRNPKPEVAKPNDGVVRTQINLSPPIIEPIVVIPPQRPNDTTERITISNVGGPMTLVVDDDDTVINYQIRALNNIGGANPILDSASGDTVDFRGVDAAGQLQASTAGGDVVIRGNGKDGYLKILDTDTTELAFVEWEDGLVKTEGPVNATIPGSGTPYSPPTGTSDGDLQQWVSGAWAAPNINPSTGDILYYDGGWKVLSASSASGGLHVLTSEGGVPSWTATSECT